MPKGSEGDLGEGFTKVLKEWSNPDYGLLQGGQEPQRDIHKTHHWILMNKKWSFILISLWDVTLVHYYDQV